MSSTYRQPSPTAARAIAGCAWFAGGGWLAVIALLAGMVSAEAFFAVMGWAVLCLCAGSMLWLITPSARVAASLVAFGLVSSVVAILVALFTFGSEMLAGAAAILIVAAAGTGLAGYRATRRMR